MGAEGRNLLGRSKLWTCVCSRGTAPCTNDIACLQTSANSPVTLGHYWPDDPNPPHDVLPWILGFLGLIWGLWGFWALWGLSGLHQTYRAARVYWGKKAAGQLRR